MLDYINPSLRVVGDCVKQAHAVAHYRSRAIEQEVDRGVAFIGHAEHVIVYISPSDELVSPAHLNESQSERLQHHAFLVV